MNRSNQLELFPRPKKPKKQPSPETLAYRREYADRLKRMADYARLILGVPKYGDIMFVYLEDVSEGYTDRAKTVLVVLAKRNEEINWSDFGIDYWQKTEDGRNKYQECRSYLGNRLYKPKN